MEPLTQEHTTYMINHGQPLPYADLPDGAWKFAKAASTCIIFALALVGKSIVHRAFACLVRLPSRVEFCLHASIWVE
jgi:hypothetical protein